MTDEDNDRYRAPALDKGLDILELLAAVDGGLTQAEIAKRLDRSPNEFYRMLDRLVKRGYVTRIDGDRFSLLIEKRFRGTVFKGYGRLLGLSFINQGKKYEAFLYPTETGDPVPLPALASRSRCTP